MIDSGASTNKYVHILSQSGFFSLLKKTCNLCSLTRKQGKLTRTYLDVGWLPREAI